MLPARVMFTLHRYSTVLVNLVFDRVLVFILRLNPSSYVSLILTSALTHWNFFSQLKGSFPAGCDQSKPKTNEETPPVLPALLPNYPSLLVREGAFPALVFPVGSANPRHVSR